MDDKLSEVVNGVRTSADAVAHAATDLSIGNDDLSQRTQEQASALQQTAASMEQMTTTVKRNADNADRANQLAASARSQAMQGATVVQDAVAAMDEINGSSGRIAEIISVIDEIAFQTNLLALNAAVEAARAGEQGRGFAVVATEVRNLAQRSAAAAKQSKELINESVSKVKNGASLVDATGEKLQQIKESVNKVCDIIAEIAAASAEQASGISQVNHAITQMDQTTQQNAALVEEAAAASKGLQHQAHDFIAHVSFFHRTGDTQSSSPAVSRSDTPREQPRAVRRQPAVSRTERTAPQRVAKVSGGENWEEF
jgi:methyl-accepting chemotaxis protein